MAHVGRTRYKLREERAGLGDYVGLQELLDGSGGDVAGKHRRRKGRARRLIPWLVFGPVVFALWIAYCLLLGLIAVLLFLYFAQHYGVG